MGCRLIIENSSPARLYVTDMTKMILTKFIMEYDIELAKENVLMAVAWGILRIPNSKVAFVPRKRTKTIKKSLVSTKLAG